MTTSDGTEQICFLLASIADKYKQSRAKLSRYHFSYKRKKIRFAQNEPKVCNVEE